MDNDYKEKVDILEEENIREAENPIIKEVFSQIIPFIQRQVDLFITQLKYLRLGGENKVIRLDDQSGLWIGHAEYASAPFKVDLSGNLYTGGTLKTAVVKTSDGNRELYCIESPEVWFVDFCKRVQVPSPFWARKYIYHIDPIFAQVTQGPYRYIQTAEKDIFQVWGKRRFHANRRFERVENEDYRQNERFWRGQRPKARPRYAKGNK